MRIDSNLIEIQIASLDRLRVRRGLEVIERETCIRFYGGLNQADDDFIVSFFPNYVRIVDDGGCWSHVGMMGGEQELSLSPGCVHENVVQHEFIHAAGFMHMQIREDRDSFIRINYDNIREDDWWIFERLRRGTHLSFDTSYDFSSCMHYEAYTFGINPRIPTIFTIDPQFQNRLGSGDSGPSDDDIRRLNRMYQCTNVRLN
jgi:hypothetical protein